MKRYRIIGRLFILLAVLLSDVMCAVTAYQYCALQWGGRYEGYSAPASAALLYAVPFGVGIAACIALAAVFYRKDKGK